MKFSSIVARRRVAGISAGCLLGGIAMGIVGAPSAAAAPDCSPEGVNATVSSATGAAQQYLAAHPGANQVVSSAYGQPRGEAAANIRGYFTAHS
ncbi:MAG: heme-binding protein, partial [Mycobacterium sp.]|nr:heme-binding protein [Mycobacterium sp.]